MGGVEKGVIPEKPLAIRVAADADHAHTRVAGIPYLGWGKGV